jgi:hypothetical protein
VAVLYGPALKTDFFAFSLSLVLKSSSLAVYSPVPFLTLLLIMPVDYTGSEIVKSVEITNPSTGQRIILNLRKPMTADPTHAPPVATAPTSTILQKHSEQSAALSNSKNTETLSRIVGYNALNNKYLTIWKHSESIPWWNSIEETM